jgi:hypothetical protein
MKLKPILFFLALSVNYLTYGQVGTKNPTTETSGDKISLWRTIFSDTADTTGTKGFENKKGLFLVPVDNYISAELCCTEQNADKSPSTLSAPKQNILLIVCKTGANALSIFKGKVIGVVKIGDNWTVIIRHGQYLSIYPNLSTVSVSANQVIDEKQKIGTIAIKDNLTTLKFQLWKSEEKINPADWIKQSAIKNK